MPDGWGIIQSAPAQWESTRTSRRDYVWSWAFAHNWQADTSPDRQWFRSRFMGWARTRVWGDPDVTTSDP